jgi:hypothetical protein
LISSGYLHLLTTSRNYQHAAAQKCNDEYEQDCNQKSAQYDLRGRDLGVQPLDRKGDAPSWKT